MKNFLDQIAQIDSSDTFNAELFAEWFIDGELADKDIAALSGEQVDAVAENILQRWGAVDAQAWDDKALPLLKID